MLNQVVSKALTRPATCCPRYQIDGNFLLETQSGRVWKYDQGGNVFVAVDRKLSQSDYRVFQANVGELVRALQAQVPLCQ